MRICLLGIFNPPVNILLRFMLLLLKFGSRVLDINSQTQETDLKDPGWLKHSVPHARFITSNLP